MPLPTVRIFVPTYRRSQLLPRALRSIQAQTFTDWIAEVHNDDPDDPAPGKVVAEFNDPRIRYVRHEKRLGGAQAFNLVFQEHPEPFYAMLEDDNWWHPEFLATMLDALNAHPEATVAWSNQELWEELPDHSWRDTGRCVRPTDHDGAPQVCSWPHPWQCFGALHANGTLLMRSRPGGAYPTPIMELGGTEAVRERCFPHPLLYVPRPLGVYAITLETFRSRAALEWATNQVLLSASYLLHAPMTQMAEQRLWEQARAAKPRMTDTLLYATMQHPALRRHRRHARFDDWRHLFVRAVRRPSSFWHLLRASRRRPHMWNFLDTHSAERTREAAARNMGLAPAPF